MSQLDKPNLILPMAPSYNQRGVDAYTVAVTNSIDQRKINCMYEPVTNAITGKTTLYLTKRPGAAGLGLNMGSVNDIPYLIVPDPSGGGVAWIACKNGSDIVVKDEVPVSTTVLTQSSTIPAYFDRTVVSGVQYGVLQVYRTTTGIYRTFYSSAIGTWTEVTDADYTAIKHVGKMEHIDGFAFIMERDTNKIWNSDLNSLANWTATNYTTKSIEQDYARGLARLGNLLLAFGAETVESFHNAGNATASPLERIAQLSDRVGMVLYYTDSEATPALIDSARHYYATLGKRLYFIGRKGGMYRHNLGFYVFDGSSFNKISSPHIDKYLQDTHGGFYHLNPFNVAGQEGIAICMTGVSAATQRWLMYFPKWNDWFEWNSTIFQAVTDGKQMIGVGGTATANDTFSFGSDYWRDGATDYTMSVQFKIPHAGSDRQFMRWAGVKGDTARSALSLSVEFSDDDYQTWQTARTIDMTASKKNIYRCGSYLGDRAVRLSHTGNLEVRLENFLSRID